MPKQLKFRASLPKVRIVNRCIMCGKSIPMGYAICSSCNAKRQTALKKYIRNKR